MFYVLVGLWVAAGLLAYTFRQQPYQSLCQCCPCIAILGASIATALYLTQHPLAAIITIATAVYALIIVRWAMVMQKRNLRW